VDEQQARRVAIAVGAGAFILLGVTLVAAWELDSAWSVVAVAGLAVVVALALLGGLSSLTFQLGSTAHRVGGGRHTAHSLRRGLVTLGVCNPFANRPSVSSATGRRRMKCW
jgi:hypothetical protein